MKVLLLLWIALILLSGCENVNDEEKTTSYSDYGSSVTATPDYDYTFDYYYVTAKESASSNSESFRSTNHQSLINTLLMSLAALLR